MKIKRVMFMLWAAWSFSTAANLQPQDLLFISTHRNPTKVVSDDKVAYMLTENGVLLYDYRKDQWIDDIGAGMGVTNIVYNSDKAQLLMATPNGTMEYNPTFHRINPSNATFAGNTTFTTPGDLNGLQLGSDFTYLNESNGNVVANVVRDRYNRRATVTSASVFNYDQLWVLTAGNGAFLGSARRKEAASVWFGLYDSSVTAVYSDGNRVWFGSPNTAGALVGAKSDLTDWKIYASQQDYDFIDGSINDMVMWHDYLWIATGKGVVRQDPKSGQFRLFRRLQGSTDIAVYRLYVHQDQLYAGTAYGVAVIDDPEGSFHNSDLPINIEPIGHDFCSKDKDLWAATSLGLFVLQKDGWKSVKDVTKQDVPDAYGSDVPTVGFKDSSLFWASGGKVYEKPHRQQTNILFAIGNNVFRILFEGDNLFAGYEGGVRVYNLKSRLWADFLLTDGIPGHTVQTFFVRDGILWIGTDLGVMRINMGTYLP